MKTFILLSGLPAVGKSTWSEQYRRTHKNVVVVSSDEIRKELSGSYQNFTNETNVWKTFIERIKLYEKLDVENITVIADSTNLTNEYRKMYHDAAEGYDFRLLIELVKPFETLLKQNKMRAEEKWVPVSAMEKMRTLYEAPNEEILGLFDEYRRINSWFDSSFVPLKWYGIKEIKKDEKEEKRKIIL